jgi:ERF superfamily
MQTSDEINEIAAALAKAQGIIKNPAKTRENPHFRSTYADLATGLNGIRHALSAQEIAVVQATDINRDGVVLVTRLIHTSGQWIGCIYPVAANAATDHQKLGAALTYAKRQALFSLVGVCGEDEDDDGEGAVTRGINQGTGVQHQTLPFNPDDLVKNIVARGNGRDETHVSDMISDLQLSDLRSKIAAVGADEQRFLKFLKIGGLAALPAREFDRAMSELNRKVSK